MVSMIFFLYTIYLFYLAAFKNFLFIPAFLPFDKEVLKYAFLCVYSNCGSLVLLAYRLIFLKNIITNTCLCLILTYRSLRPFLFLFFYGLSFILYSFYGLSSIHWYIFFHQCPICDFFHFGYCIFRTPFFVVVISLIRLSIFLFIISTCPPNIWLYLLQLCYCFWLIILLSVPIVYWLSILYFSCFVYRSSMQISSFPSLCMSLLPNILA